MKAVAYYQPLPAEHPEALQDVQLADPTPGPHDLLVEVRAISVNPVDTKIRHGVIRLGDARTTVPPRCSVGMQPEPSRR